MVNEGVMMTIEENTMKIKLDDTDQKYVADANLSESNRIIARE